MCKVLVSLHKFKLGTNYLLEDQEVLLDVAIIAVKIPRLSHLASKRIAEGRLSLSALKFSG